MSMQATALVLDFAPAHWNTGTRLVAIAIADRVGQDNHAWPSIEDLARRTGMSVRMVRYHANQLETEGVIRREIRRRPNGTQASNMWIWLWTMQLGNDGTVYADPP